MNKHILLLALLMTAVIPWIVYSSVDFSPAGAEQPDNTADYPQSSAEAQPLSENATVSVMLKDNVVTMDIEEYIQGVILGEIPKDFDTQTLMAQAVAARSYSLYRIREARSHRGAYLCTDPGCCQAFCSAENYIQDGGSAEYVQRVREAVMKTAGEVLLYDGKIIEATYFSSSGGRTEDAVEVWGTDVPYLQAVDSEGEDAGRYDGHRCVFSHSEFLIRLRLPDKYMGKITVSDCTYTAGNGVATIVICREEFTGKEIRERLDLPSTVFDLLVDEDTVIVVSDGNGHRVGMSQYGAEAMAKNGKDYRQILAHYYSGTVLYQMGTEEMKGIFDKAGNL